jgi:enoyl-CoA hydratase/carnithine racemase
VSGSAPELAIDGREAIITLRRPLVANRLEFSDLEQMRNYLRHVNKKREILVLHLRGEGKHFCSGFNVNHVVQSKPEATFEFLANELERARPVTIAAIQGGVYGGATDLALACDFRYGSPKAQMFVPAVKLGLLFYQGGLHRYVSRLGINVAKRLLLTGKTFNAEQMYACGFLTDMSKPDELIADCDALGQRLVNMAPLALLGIKKHLTRIAGGCFDAHEYAVDLSAVMASTDLQEGELAWREKRMPVFQGR